MIVKLITQTYSRVCAEKGCHACGVSTVQKMLNKDKNVEGSENLRVLDISTIYWCDNSTIVLCVPSKVTPANVDRAIYLLIV